MNDKLRRQYLDDGSGELVDILLGERIQATKLMSRELQDLLFDGRRVQALKLMRERLGCGLKDGKDMVEAVEARMRERFPDAFPAKQGTGCGMAILLFAVLAYFGYNLVFSATC